jgi:D-serine dehydratase
MTPVEILEAAVLGGTPEEPNDEPIVLIIDAELSATLELGVIVMADARRGLLESPDRRVTASLPSCVAVPSRRS